MGVFSHMHRKELGTWHAQTTTPECYKSQVWEIKAAAGEGKQDNSPEIQNRSAREEKSILVKRQAFYFFISF